VWRGCGSFSEARDPFERATNRPVIGLAEQLSPGRNTLATKARRRPSWKKHPIAVKVHFVVDEEIKEMVKEAASAKSGAATSRA
jgi:hypothetical protein